jgi:hypothetical protein
MRTHVADLFGLREDLKQLVVREEIESSKYRTLLLKVISKPFLDDFKVFVGLLELLLEALLRAGKKDIGGLFGLVDDVAPGRINRLKALGFLRKLFHDIR